MAVIDGRRIRANVAGRATSMAGTLQVVEPATEDVLEEIPRAGAEDVDAAVARARSAYPAGRRPGALGRLSRGGGRPRRGTAPASCTGWPTRWAIGWRSSPSSRRATP